MQSSDKQLVKILYILKNVTMKNLEERLKIHKPNNSMTIQIYRFCSFICQVALARQKTAKGPFRSLNQVAICY